MKTIDDFLKDIINTDYTRASEFVEHLGYEYGQVESYFKKVKEDHPSWLSGVEIVSPVDIKNLGYKGDRSKWEIEQFFKDGGYTSIEAKKN